MKIKKEVIYSIVIAIILIIIAMYCNRIKDYTITYEIDDFKIVEK